MSPKLGGYGTESERHDAEHTRFLDGEHFNRHTLILDRLAPNLATFTNLHELSLINVPPLCDCELIMLIEKCPLRCAFKLDDCTRLTDKSIYRLVFWRDFKPIKLSNRISSHVVKF